MDAHVDTYIYTRRCKNVQVLESGIINEKTIHSVSEVTKTETKSECRLYGHWADLMHCNRHCTDIATKPSAGTYHHQLHREEVMRTVVQGDE